MKTNLFKRIFAFVLAMSVITIPALSFAGTETVLTDFNAAAITPGEYTMVELNEKMTTGTVIQPSYDGYYNDACKITVADGVATFGAVGSSRQIEPTFQFGQTVTKGVVTFDFNMINTNVRGDEWFGILDASGNRKIIFEPTMASVWIYLNFGYDNVPEKKYGLLHGSTFSDGKLYYTSTNRTTDQSMNTRLVLMREETTDDWAVKVYDLDVSAENTIFEGTISKDALDGITGSYTSAWNGGRKIETWKATLSDYPSTKVNVASVSPASSIRTNAAELTVTFTGEIAPATVQNITFAAAGGANMVKSVTAAADNLSATVELNTLTNGTAYTLTVPEAVTAANGKAIEPYTSTITADAALNTLFNLDFTNVTGTGLTTEQIKTATGETRLSEGAIPNTYTVADGVATITSDGASKDVEVKLTFDEPVESGCVEFVEKINIGLLTGYSSQYHLEIASSNGNYRSLVTSVRYGSYGFYINKANQGATGEKFISGADYYATGEENTAYDIKVVVMRDDTTSDWRVRMYDMNVSLSAPIYVTTLPAEDYPAIVGARSRFWQTEGMGLLVRSYSAAYGAMETIAPIETMRVENADGAYINSLVDGGNVKCVVDVNRTGGKLYAAIYTEGWKLVDVKSVTPTAMGEVEIPFENVAADASQHMKLFYWDNGFKPLTGNYMNPLVRQ